ncbi:MAG: hypothetical protein R3Y22_04605 [Bacteroidales bacterium]
MIQDDTSGRAIQEIVHLNQITKVLIQYDKWRLLIQHTDVVH